MGLVKALSLEQDRGILVNNHMQSSVPELFAAGDVAQVYDRWTQQHHLDVLWPSAINEGRAAGYNMVDVARGKNPAYTYEKGSPFNAALLFGVHLTVIGQISGDRGEDGDEGGAFFMSRGSSQVWTAPFRTGVRSAWDHEGPNSIRLATAEGRIIGALLMGNQELADPLRYLVNNEVDISKREEQILRADADLPALVMQLYAEAR
jgi:NAD(P)H-nitrite reductase large subunit